MVMPPKFEPFTTLLLKVQEFLDDNREYRVLNAQTLDVRYKSVPAPALTKNTNNSQAKDRHSISTNTDTCHPNAVQTLRNDDPIGVTPDLLTPDDLTEVKEDRDHNESVHEQPQHLVFNRKQPVRNFESHYIRIMYDHNLHGPLYTCKRHLEFFMERDEWRAPGVEHRWTYLCAETIPVLAKDEDEIADKIDVTLFTTKHTLLQMPRVYYAVRLYFDTRVEFVGPPYGTGSTKRSLLKSFSLRSNSDRQSLKRDWFERRTHSEVSAYRANSMDEEAKTAPVAPDVAKDKDKRGMEFLVGIGVWAQEYSVCDDSQESVSKMAYRFMQQNIEKRYIDRQLKIDDIIVFDEDLPPRRDCRLTFVDFAPVLKVGLVDRIGSWSLMTSPNDISLLSVQYTKLVDFANKWLKDRQFWDVVCCETVNAILVINVSQSGAIIGKRICKEFKTNEQGPVFGCNTHPVKMLRVWIKPVDSREYNEKVRPIVPQIQFRDFEPRILDSSNNRFESIDEVVARLNGAINAEEITGKILNVQTLACSATQDWKVDPQSTQSMIWKGKMVYVLRVFYVLGPIHEEEVGLADFVPQCLGGEELFKRPKFESQSCLLRKASKWLSENPEINFCSAMSLDVNHNGWTPIDTKKMSARGGGDFIRILRIMYTKPREVPEDIPISLTLPPPPPIYLEHRTFVLHKDYSEIKRAINDFVGRDEWLTSQTQFKWHLMSCQTVPVFANNGLKTSLESNSDQSFQALLSSNLTLSRREYFALRLYYDVGYYGVDHTQGQRSTATNSQDTELVDFANKWLLDREHWDVISCETVGAIIQIQLNDYGFIERKRVLTTYTIPDTYNEGVHLTGLLTYKVPVNLYVKMLRLWVRPFDTREYNEKVRPIVPQIQFRDFEPRILDSKSNRFESIDEVVARLNGAINAEEITGKILNVQTLACSATQDWQIDSQCTQSTPWIGKTVFVLRVFWTIGPIQDEEVGLADFVPQCL
ncbi:unnamed protein product, partial [Oppiella nova]